MVTFTINIPPMLAYIPYMDPMGYGIWDAFGSIRKMLGHPTPLQLKNGRSSKEPCWIILSHPKYKPGNHRKHSKTMKLHEITMNEKHEKKWKKHILYRMVVDGCWVLLQKSLTEVDLRSDYGVRWRLKPHWNKHHTWFLVAEITFVWNCCGWAPYQPSIKSCSILLCSMGRV
jgi:hypothetical protein